MLNVRGRIEFTIYESHPKYKEVLDFTSGDVRFGGVEVVEYGQPGWCFRVDYDLWKMVNRKFLLEKETLRLNPVTCYGDIRDDQHGRVVLSAIRNLGVEHLVDQDKDSATDMFNKAWQAFTCDTDMNENQVEDMLAAEINSAINRE